MVQGIVDNEEDLLKLTLVLLPYRVVKILMKRKEVPKEERLKDHRIDIVMILVKIDPQSTHTLKQCFVSLHSSTKLALSLILRHQVMDLPLLLILHHQVTVFLPLLLMTLGLVMLLPLSPMLNR
jgi:hypothetical protein